MYLFAHCWKIILAAFADDTLGTNFVLLDSNSESGIDEGFLKSPEELAELFGSMGISDVNTIVIYDDGSQKPASRVYWVLKYLGAKNVRILHKDMAAFKKSRVPLTAMKPKAKTATFTLNLNNAIFANTDDVKLGKAKLFDARDSKEFAGTTEKSKGHIPGSLNLNFEEVLDTNKDYMTKADMEKVVSKFNISPDDAIIVSCQSGKRAAVLFVAFTNVLGYKNVKVYDGSYYQWVADGNSIEK